MNASALQAGAHALKAFMGLALAHSLSAGIPALNWKQAGIVFAFAFVYEVVNWFDRHPVPVAPAENTGTPGDAPHPAGSAAGDPSNSQTH